MSSVQIPANELIDLNHVNGETFYGTFVGVVFRDAEEPNMTYVIPLEDIDHCSVQS
jgi:hypothetical protein